jgi:RNA polymerase sigma factor (sigma-70 family)
MHGQEDDIALIQMVLQGTQAAYGKLVARYQGYVFSIAYRHVDDRELAEELAQDVFVKAYRSLADFKGNSKFSTWLYTIVHHTCMSHLRKKGSNTVFPGDEPMQAITAATGFATLPHTGLEQKTQKQLLDKAIQYLPQADAEIITLFYLAEQSIDEIGVITGLTPGNVKVKLFRARQKLKEILETKFSREVIM